MHCSSRGQVPESSPAGREPGVKLLTMTRTTFSTLCTLFSPPRAGSADAGPDGRPDHADAHAGRTAGRLRHLHLPHPDAAGATGAVRGGGNAGDRRRRRSSKRRSVSGATATSSIRRKARSSTGRAPRAASLSYNEFWYERGIELTSDKRTLADRRSAERAAAAPVRRRPSRARPASGRRTAASICTTPTRNRKHVRPAASWASTRAPPMTSGHLQQQRDDLPGARLRRHPERDGAQRADHPDRRHRQAALPAAQRRLPRPLGRRDPRHRDRPVRRGQQQPVVDQHAPDRAAGADSIPIRSLTSTR